uniref:Uncharacterized protein n=1 Tax=Aegilops tauschii subsp. strangulata TaxID=200361 RepID=A0A453GZA2_AEGTS
IFSRKGASGFSWASTADQVTAGISAAGLTAIVTGASSGIGAETARVLAARGAHVVMAVRNLAAAEAVRQAVLAETPGGSVEVMELDLSSLASVRNFAADFAATGLPLNILVNNAGVMATPFSLSKDGIEMQFATNHVGMHDYQQTPTCLMNRFYVPSYRTFILNSIVFSIFLQFGI